MAATYDWIWHELMTTDPDAAARFYGEVIGWKIKPFPAPAGTPPYLVGHVGERGVIGIMSMPPTVPPGMPPNWTGYIHTHDVDATAKAVSDAGGSVKFGPTDIPGVGRIAAVADPEGGVFNLMQPLPTDAPAMLPMGTPGTVSWCELHSNQESNLDFYLKLFGWRKSDATDMGEYGTYQMFTTNDSPATGGSMRKVKDSPEAGLPTYWLFYFSVNGIDAAMERAKQAGGNIFMGPHEVPGGTWIALGHDPQGALFALHSQTR